MANVAGITSEDIELAIAARLAQRLASANPVAHERLAQTLGSDLAGRGDARAHLALYGADELSVAQAVHAAASMVSVASGAPLLLNPGIEEPIASGSLVVIDSRGLDASFHDQVLAHALAAAGQNQAAVCWIGSQTLSSERVRSILLDLSSSAPDTSLVALLNPEPSQGLDDWLNLAAHFQWPASSPAPRTPRP